jgi:hypothetical protein
MADRSRPNTRGGTQAGDPTLTTPMSQSSKTLARTFESILTKNESGGFANHRPQARYANHPLAVEGNFDIKKSGPTLRQAINSNR